MKYYTETDATLEQAPPITSLYRRLVLYLILYQLPNYQDPQTNKEIFWKT